jgi:hypothetical protein
VAARKLITIEGRRLPYSDGEWVVWNPEGKMVGCQHTDARTADDPVKAARGFWGSTNEAMTALNKGYKIELILRSRLHGLMVEAGWVTE